VSVNGKPVKGFLGRFPMQQSGIDDPSERLWDFRKKLIAICRLLVFPHISVRTMPASRPAAIAAAQQILCGKDPITIFKIVVFPRD
jgi:hypothetical protein